MFVLSLQSQSGIILITCIFMINSEFGPIVIGGIGGSGTRLIAQILKELKFFIGHDLNEPLDNLSFTLLFKRRDWFYRNRNNKRSIFNGLRILEKSMLTASPNFSVFENLFLRKATASMFKYGHNVYGDGKAEWAIERFQRIKEGWTDNGFDYVGWGWKEPNSHLLLPYLNAYFPNLKYIHTIRNGLDMAFSSNQQQLFNWGPMYGIELPKNDDDIPEASFRYWAAANKKVVEIGNTMGENRFYLLNFDLLCLDKEHEIKKMLSFLNIDFKNMDLKNLLELPKLPISFRRYIDRQLNWCTEEDKYFLKSFNFHVD